MRFFLIGLWLFSFGVWAQEAVDLRSDREGESFYSSKAHTKQVARLLKEISGDEVILSFKNALASMDDSSLCSYDLNQKLISELALRGSNAQVRFGPIIYFLRSQGVFDDVVAGLLLEAYKVRTTDITAKEGESIYIPDDTELDPEILKLVASFPKKFAAGACFDEAYKNFYSELLKMDKKLKSRDIRSIYLKAFTHQHIDQETYLALEQARVNELESRPLDLKSYYQKVRTLRLQYPLRDSSEKSDFVTQKIKKLKLSHRQKLFQNYSDIQIMLMGNMIKQLKADIVSPKMEILIYEDQDTVARVITLSPGQRFCSATNFLRSDMANLALNSYFNGRSPDYLDLITASYELGIIPASEVDTIAGIQDIWNPKKTFWDKAGVWVRTLSSVATIVIPPPYGFLPALGIVVIEATTKKDVDNDRCLLK